MSGRLPRPWLGLFCLWLAVFLVAVFGAAPLHAQATLQSGGLVLSQEGTRARLELPDGKTLPLALPAQAEISSLAELDRGWIVAASVPDEDQRHLVLLAGNETESRALPVPADQLGRQRRGAVLLARNGHLQGLAWLEGDGDSALSVRAAAWDGERWSAPEAISRTGPGSQIALAGTVLADGSWLLAWSAFDGEDDEIVWSRRSVSGGAARWSPVHPVSVANTVPDITPTVAAAGNRALIAWSRYDGNDFRVRVARLAGAGWKDERDAGPAGSVHPFFQETGQERDSRLHLLYLSLRPLAWSLQELDANGRELRRSSIPAASRERPAVVADPSGGLRLRWAARKRELPVEWERKKP